MKKPSLSLWLLFVFAPTLMAQSRLRPNVLTDRVCRLAHRPLII
jgi:hypothetical protein